MPSKNRWIYILTNENEKKAIFFYIYESIHSPGSQTSHSHTHTRKEKEITTLRQNCSRLCATRF